MDDLFDAFDSIRRDEEANVEDDDEVENGETVTDKMASLQAKKLEEARNFSENILNRLSSGSQKRRHEDDSRDEPLAKIPELQQPMDNDEEDDEINFPECHNFEIHQFNVSENCTHEVVSPLNTEYVPLRDRDDIEPAKKFPFTLDPFQVQAVKCIDNSQSVLVSAHTSAGKTAVALYAIAKALEDNQRVIYTSPIKALSNQKYRDLCDDFPDVGLVTGDVTLNPNASCVVMTTEILRSMLYRGTEIMREVGWVIFDEIHYMRDAERGLVWEEAIILLPDNVRYVFLSATIPNARQFAEWITFLHKQPCHVVYTDYRPTPLQHFIYSSGSDGLYEVVDIKGNFKEEQFAKAMSFLQNSDDPMKAAERPRGPPQNSSSDVLKIIRTVKERDMLPCIIFSFSRKECESYAAILKGVDFNTEDEKRAVKIVYDNAISFLSDEDRKLPQISTLLPFLMRGVGIHHSGLLPILKEVTEILFGEGLIKTLFATETFAMGLNMPAKTVLFTSTRKFDGQKNRLITSGEYIQMSGRAGRRGKDDRGLVILMVTQQMTESDAKQIIKGQSDPLNSQYRLTYNMVLNLMRVPDINPTYMLQQSFKQFQNYSSLPDLHKKMRDKKLQLERFHVDCALEIQGYCEMEKQKEQLRESIQKRVLKPVNVVPYFQPGRMLKIKSGLHDFGWTSLVSYSKKPDPLNPLSGTLLYIVEVAVILSAESARNITNVQQLQPPQQGESGVVEVVPFTFECIKAVSTIRLKLPENMKTLEAKKCVLRSIQEAKKRMNNHIPEVDPIAHMKIRGDDLKRDIHWLTKMEDRLKNHALKDRDNFQEIYASYQRKLKLEEEYKEAKAAFNKAKSLLQEDELACRKRVLRRLQYCDENDVITVKGRVACELSSADELLLTEMIFTAAFNNLSPSSCAALMSCFVFEEKSSSVVKMDDDLKDCLKILQSHAKKIAQVVAESKVEIDEEKYVSSFSPQLMGVVYKWCSGASFSEIVQSTDVFEGSIIRCMRRLELVLAEMVNAAKSYGDKTLEEKFETARTLLKRDIVFSASLYL